MADRRRAWARALFQAAPDRERRLAYGEALDGLARALETFPRARDLLRDPGVTAAEKRAFLASALERGPGGAVDPVFDRFCALLVEKRRMDLVPAIAAVFRLIADAADGLARVEVAAARPVPEGVLARLAEAWKAFSGAARAEASLRVDPALIAGYRLRAGSLQLDYSVAGRLERIRRELARPLASGPVGAGRGEG